MKLYFKIHTVGAKFQILLVVFSVVAMLAGGGSLYYLGKQLTGLATDPNLPVVLRQAQQGWREVAKTRRDMAEAFIKQCINDKTVSSCPVTKNFTHPTFTWKDEQTLLLTEGNTTETIEFTWTPVRPNVESIFNYLATHEHVSDLIPKIMLASVFIFSAIMFVILMIALAISLNTSRKLGRRIQSISKFVSDVGSGKDTRYDFIDPKRDEIGVLASEIKKMVENLDSAKDQAVLSERLKAWQEVARSFVHEVKNQISPIQLMAEEIQHRFQKLNLESAKSLQAPTQQIQDECKQLQRLIDEFSGFARLPEPILIQHEMNALLSEFCKRYQNSADVIFEIQTDSDKIPVLADRGLLFQALTNLVKNAIEAKATLPVRIKISASTNDQLLNVKVVDDGPGIPLNSVPNIFEPGFSGNKSRGDLEKMGFGLSIAQKILVDHRGKIVLESTGATGSSFRMDLPLANQ